MARKWAGRYFFHWRPQLSFNQRRDEFARWIDKNANPRAILDEKDRLGFAVGHRLLRVTLYRGGFEISLSTSRVTIAALEHSLRAAFEVFAPSDFHVAGGSTVHTTEIYGDYYALRKRLAQRFAGPLPKGYSFVDCSATVDLELASASMKIQFGVVERQELVSRK